MARNESRSSDAHEGDLPASGFSSSPRRLTTACRIASETIRRASLVTIDAASMLARGTIFCCSENSFG